MEASLIDLDADLFVGLAEGRTSEGAAVDLLDGEQVLVERIVEDVLVDLHIAQHIICHIQARVQQVEGGVVMGMSHCLLEGLDDIGITLQHADKIEAFEKEHRIYGFATPQ